MPDGILIIDKPTGWTGMDVCFTRSMMRGDTSIFILGGSEFACGRFALRRNA